MPATDQNDQRGRSVPFSPTIMLLTVARTVDLEVSRMLEAYGLTIRKYGVLGHIAAIPGLSMSDLGRRSGITVQSVHSLIRSLADASLVRSEVEGSGFAARVTVTPAGEALLQRVAISVAEIDRTLFATKEMKGLSEALAVVRESRKR